jgi:Flp pilus assembly protein TadD
MAKIKFALRDSMIEAQKAYQNGNYIDALQSLEKIIKETSNSGEAYRLQAACYMQLNEFDNAKKSLQKIISLNQATGEDYQNLARTFTLLQQFPDAEKIYLECIKQSPQDIELNLELIDVFLKQNKRNHANAYIKAILSIFPEQADALYKQAMLENNELQANDAITKMATQKPFDSNLKLFLAKHYLEQANFKKSLYYLAQATSNQQDAWFLPYLVGLRYYTTERYKSALKFFENAINLAPERPDTHLALGMLYLTEGNLEAGWREFEWRLKFPQSEYIAAFLKKYPYWNGQDIQGKHLLVYAEANMGLTFLFLRYLLELTDTKSKITFLVPSAQSEIISGLNVIDNIVTENNVIPTDIDYIVSLQSLPFIKQRDYGASVLLPNKNTASLFSNVITKIGLSWKASEATPYGKINPIHVETLTPLITSVNAKFYCLCTNQLNEHEIEWCKQNNIELFHGSNELFVSYIDALDLIITTDNDLAHIAASIDKPTWVMVPYAKSWYFGTTPSSTPWYSAMHLFHQPRIKEWSVVVDQITSALINQSLSVNPENDLIKEVTALAQNQQYQLCFDLAKKALAHYPTQLSFKFFLGIAASQLEQDKLAFSSLLDIYQFDKTNIDVTSLLGSLFYRNHDIDKALFYLKKTVELTPENPEALKQLAIAQCELHAPEEAIKLFRKAVSLDAKDEYNFGLALALLTAGKFQEGWQQYEYRLKMPTHVYTVLKPNTPFWDGCNLDGKSIFIMQEQGLGDNIQFLRFIKLLKASYDCKIILGCSANLRRIAMQLPEIDQIISETEIIPEHDYHLPLLSLALRLKINSPKQFMGKEPYIKAQTELANYWQNYFALSNDFKIGFCWAGSKSHFNNARRNCDLLTFIKLLSNEDTKLYSLQKDLTADDKELLTLSGIDDLGEMFDDLADTAAAISQLDLIISIDSAIAHLASAMGKETWLVLPYYVEWRHPRQYEYSPWYKSMKYYRQEKPGDWDSAFKKVNSDLYDRQMKKGR